MSEQKQQMAWLTIVGVTQEGVDTLSSTAKHALNEAAELYGSERHLSLIPEAQSPKAKRIEWHSPLSEQLTQILENKNDHTVILASGDPMYWGIGETIAKKLDYSEFNIIPAISIISQITAKLKWSPIGLTSLSLCSQSIEQINAYLQPNHHLILLSANETTPKSVVEHLTEKGFGASEITLLENLGSKTEKITTHTVSSLKEHTNISPLNSLAIHLKAEPNTKSHALVPGLDDDAYEHDGQITKRSIRAITLANLAPTPRAHLWDIGTGSGSIAIEWCRSGNQTTATAIDKNNERLERAERNAKKLGVTTIEFIHGQTPDVFANLKTPDAIFIGGGLTKDNSLTLALQALAPGGRLVANAVTIESETKLIEAAKSLGGSLTKIAISAPDQIGNFNAWRPQMPVTQWVFKKPH